MDQYFRDTLEGLKTAAQHMQRASEEIQLAGQALVRTVDAALHAKDEHEDVRVTVARLEGLVLDLVKRLPPTPPNGIHP
jgi:hypothetical protein